VLATVEGREEEGLERMGGVCVHDSVCARFSVCTGVLCGCVVTHDIHTFDIHTCMYYMYMSCNTITDYGY
jgi:hypothetical protein